LLSYNAAANEHIGRGAATLRSADTDGVAAWGTWIGGPTTGVYYAQTNGLTFPPPGGGFHYAIGKTAATLPTGTVTYALSGASQPTLDDGNPGTFDSGAVVINYDTGKVGLEINVTTDDGPATYATTGGTADLSATEGGVFMAAFFANRNTGVKGALYGKIYNDGDGLGIAYVFDAAPAADGGTAPAVRGAAGFHRQ
jgi:hypothetical protein